jgi:hypothetical protein
MNDGTALEQAAVAGRAYISTKAATARTTIVSLIG